MSLAEARNHLPCIHSQVGDEIALEVSATLTEYSLIRPAFL